MYLKNNRISDFDINTIQKVYDTLNFKGLIDRVGQAEIIVVKFKRIVLQLGKIEQIIYQILEHFLRKNLSS